MKKVLMTALLLVCIQIGYSQQFAKNISKSNEDIENPKKKDNPKTWIERAELMRKIYNEPTSKLPDGGITEDLLVTLLKGEQVLETKEYVVDGDAMKSIVYSNKEIFVAPDGRILLLKTTKTEIDNPLDRAMEAYKKAAELGGDAKKLTEGFSALHREYDNAARGEYFAGNYPKTVELFKKALECAPRAGLLDTVNTYYVAMVSMRIKDYKTAEEYYTKAAKDGYIQGGDIYGSLYEAIRSQGAQADTLRAGVMLTEAYEKYPASLSILGSLINHYLGIGEDPAKILPILHAAQEAAPANSSLYYVEGDLYMKLNDEENAIVAYQRAVEKDPNIAIPHYRIGSIYAGRGDKLSEAANDKMGKEADALEEQAKVEYKKSIAYFETAFKLDPTEPAFADILKRLYFRLRYNGDEIDQEMMTNYEKYKAISDGMSE